MRVFSHSLFALAVALHASLTSGQDLKEQVWGVFAYTRYGDTVPSSLLRPNTLTPLGANQLYEAGSAFRNRYVALHGDDEVSGFRIESLSSYMLRPEQIDVFTNTDAAVVASAQAFMQGLYPPLNDSYGSAFSEPLFGLANGSTTMGPLNGYQFPRVLTYSSSDPQSIAVDGQAACLAHRVADVEYTTSAEFEQMKQQSEAFYQRMYEQALSEELQRSSTSYANAYPISEYLEYQSLHNETLLHVINREDIELARSLASHYVFAVNGNSTSGRLNTIAGRTLAASILQAFDSNIEDRGASSMMTLLFGSHEPIVALTSILGLASPEHTNFYSLPSHGSSVVFELYSLESERYPAYPDPSNLYVRFALRNGTTARGFQSYPLFGLSPSNIGIPYTEFVSGVKNVAVNTTEEWCHLCGSDADFCLWTLDTPENKTSGKKGMAPGVAGVIGAVVTLVTVGVIAVVGFLFCGLKTKSFRKRSLGGFKGDAKMASDCDVAFQDPSWADTKQAGMNEGETQTRGHERHGSWEMRGANVQSHRSGQEALSPFDDEHEIDDWRIHSIQQPVQAREHV